MGDRTSKNYMMPKLFKIEQDGPGRETIITNLQKKILLRIHDADKTYSEMTFDTVEARMKKLGGANDARMAQLQEKMKEMPEEQRKMVEKMMGPAMGDAGTTEVKRSDETRIIAGHSCTKFEIIQAGKTVMTVWATQELKGFGTMSSDWEEFSRRMTEQMPGIMGKGIAAGMKKIGGFPMETQIGEIVTTVTRIEPRSIPASAFEAPAGYKKVDDTLFRKQRK
jgi:Domain of unknown function (DUF4412)